MWYSPLLRGDRPFLAFPSSSHPLTYVPSAHPCRKSLRLQSHLLLLPPPLTFLTSAPVPRSRPCRPNHVPRVQKRVRPRLTTPSESFPSTPVQPKQPLRKFLPSSPIGMDPSSPPCRSLPSSGAPNGITPRKMPCSPSSINSSTSFSPASFSINSPNTASRAKRSPTVRSSAPSRLRLQRPEKRSTTLPSKHSCSSKSPQARCPPQPRTLSISFSFPP